MGVELTGKDAGRDGREAISARSCADRRAGGQGMKVIAYDPFLSEDRAKQIASQRWSWAKLLGCTPIFNHAACA